MLDNLYCINNQICQKEDHLFFWLRVDTFVQPVTDCHRLNAEINVKLGEEPACDRVMLFGTHAASPLTVQR